ncbi:MAG: hypothetical protein ABI425_02110 [Patescibacteria group bacterium]
MAKEQQRKYRVEGEWVTDAQIPEIFNLGNLFHEYQKTIASYGPRETTERFKTLLRKQLISLIQELVIQPLTPNFLYSLVERVDHIEVNDDDYPQKPNIVNRANPYEWYNLTEEAGTEALYAMSPFAKPFLDRFLLEYEQIKLLVEEYLPKDPLLSLPFIQQLSETTQPITIQLADSKTIEGFVSNWYAMAMPASQVHKGGGSYFNIYRIVAVPTENGNFEYFLQKQGLLHKLNQKRHAHDLLNIDQLEKATPQTEREIMMRIIQLSPHRNKQTPEELFIEVTQKKIPNLKTQIAKARERQESQTVAIEQSIEAILKIFEHELSQPETPDQLVRLKDFFEGIGNPLYFAKDVPQEVLVEKYHSELASGKGRDAFISSLSTAIPTILQRVAGSFFCGSMSAGGLIAKAGGAHGFGGIKIDSCTTCPNCGSSGIVGPLCNCGFGRDGMMHHVPTTNTSHPQSSHNSKTSSKKTTGPHSSGLFTILPTLDSVSINHIFSTGKASVGVNGLFN